MLIVDRVRERLSFISTHKVNLKEKVIVESKPIVPKPEVIDIYTHPLRFYPEFEDYSNEWNEYAKSTERLAKQTTVLQTELDLVTHPSPSIELLELQSKVSTLTSERENQRLNLDGNILIDKKVRIEPLKRANRKLRQAREQLEKLSFAEGKFQNILQENQLTAQQELKYIDEGFALGKDDQRLNFYVADRLRDNQEDIDQLFVKFIKINFSEVTFDDSLKIRSINYRLIHLLDRFNPELKEIDERIIWNNCGEACNRQLKLAGKSVFIFL